MTARALDVEAFLARLGCGPNLEDLIELWPIPPDRLGRALAAAGVDLDDDLVRGVWVRVHERVAEVELRRTDLNRAPALLEMGVAAALAPEPGLHVADDLQERLPLLGLAEDLARRSPGGHLAVECRPRTGLGANGWFSRTTRAAVIALADDLEDDELADVFAHELAHALDPDFDGIDPIGLEAFAYELGPMLLEVAPSCVAEAGFLVARALEATAVARRRRPQSGSVVGVVEWALADLGVVVVAQPEAIAACGRRARDAGRAMSPAHGDGRAVRVAPVAGVPGPVETIRGESRTSP